MQDTGSPGRRDGARALRPGGTRSLSSGAIRGQTTIDFALGMSVFLLSLAFVLAFVPGMLDPFTGGTQEETVTVNRVADDLSQSLLGTASEPYVLDPRCTRGFFGTSPVSDCAYAGSSIQERVGVKPYQRVNVTISGNVSAGPENVLCWDGSGFVERDEAGCTTVLARGADPDQSGSRTVSATRVVRLAGHDVTLEVEMW